LKGFALRREAGWLVASACSRSRAGALDGQLAATGFAMLTCDAWRRHGRRLTHAEVTGQG
jgi:hypothetical protein